MLLIDNGRYDLETEAMIEIGLHQPEELTGGDVDLAIDAALEIAAAEIK